MRHLIGIAILCLVVLMVGTCSCRSTKDVQKAEVKTEDSGSTTKDDSIALLKSENSRLTIENKQLQYGGVIFVHDTANHHDAITNTIEITPEGGIKAKGNISSAFFSRSLYEKVIASQKKTIDSLASIKQKTNWMLKTVTITKNKHTETSVLNFLWLLAIGFAIGKWGGKLFNLIKSKIWTT